MSTNHKEIIESCYPYSRADVALNCDDNIIEELFDILPHGSGIDYTWNVFERKHNVFDVLNSYHAMDEFGGYCHIYDFTFTVQYNGKGNLPIDEWDILRFNFRGQKESVCCGYGLKDYLYQTMEESLHA